MYFNQINLAVDCDAKQQYKHNLLSLKRCQFDAPAFVIIISYDYLDKFSMTSITIISLTFQHKQR